MPLSKEQMTEINLEVFHMREDLSSIFTQVNNLSSRMEDLADEFADKLNQIEDIMSDLEILEVKLEDIQDGESTECTMETVSMVRQDVSTTNS